MAFPEDLIVEAAFDNDLSEARYATTGWTEITEFVRSVSGTLRGRSYELDRTETGSLTVNLDNGDGRFTPGSVLSPYYPNVRSNRRLRIRGKNMHVSNVGRTGATDHSAHDFFVDPTTDTMYSTSAAPLRVEAETYVGSSQGKIGLVQDYDPADNGDVVNGLKPGSWVSYDIDFGTQTATSWSLRGGTQPGGTIELRQGSVTGTLLSTITFGSHPSYQDFETKSAAISPGITGQQQLFMVHGGAGGVATNWYEFRFAESYVNPPVAVQHDPAALGFTGDLATEEWHIEATVDAGQPAGTYRVAAWYEPIELGVRLTHSAYMWLVDGTEPLDAAVEYAITYYDADHNVLTSFSDPWDPATPTVPTRRVFSDLAPANAKYAIGSLTIEASSALTAPLTYAVAGLQTELPANLAPNISAFYNLNGWSATGDTDLAQLDFGDPNNAALIATWATTDPVEVRQSVPRLVPGDTYTVTLEAWKSAGSADVMLTADDGATVDTLTVDETWTPLTVTWTAGRSTEELKLQTATAVGDTLRVRGVNVRRGAGPLDPAGATDTDVTDWQRPKPIFEGWIEAWPVKLTAASTEDVSVTVNDRLKKLSEISFDTVVLREQLYRDGAQLVLPLGDAPNADGRLSNLGTWADVTQKSDFTLTHTRNDLTGASYTLGVDGITDDDTALKLSPANTTTGYLLVLPYSKDYAYTAPLPPSVGPGGTLPGDEGGSGAV